MENENVNSMMSVTMQKIKEMVDVNTVVGSPITTADGVTVIPVSRVSYAFGGAGSDFPTKSSSGFGGGSGAGIKIDPIGFLVIKDGGVRMITIAPPAANTVDRVIEKTPELLDMVDGLLNKYVKKPGKQDEQGEQDVTVAAQD